MKKTTLTLLLALVLILSTSVFTVFAASEEDVLTVMNDLSVMYPELYSGDSMPAASATIELSGASGEDESVMKAPINNPTLNPGFPYPFGSGTVSGSYNTCGDGTIDLDIQLERLDPSLTVFPSTGQPFAYGPNNTTYIRDISVDVTINRSGTVLTFPDLTLEDCKSSGGDSCRSVFFNASGLARMSGTVKVPEVFLVGDLVDVTVNIQNSSYKTILWNDPEWNVTITDYVTPKSYDYCRSALVTNALGSIPAVRGAYDENTHEARIQVNVADMLSSAPAYNRDRVVPGEIWVDDTPYTDYTCRYTMINSLTGAPETNYCYYGKAIPVKSNDMVRFDIEFEMDELSFTVSGPQAFRFRVGGMTSMVTGSLDPVDFPDKPVSKIAVFDPVRPFMNFYRAQPDKAIKPSGPYSVYEGAVVGTYEKCGKKAVLMIRLKNNGAEEEVIDLNNMAIAINGGTPLKFAWIASTQGVAPNKKVYLYPDDEVILLGMAKITDSPAQLNSDAEMTAAVNLLDYGMYLSGKLYSDHNNTKCVAP